MTAKNKRDLKTPVDQHRKKIGQFNNKQNEVLNKKLKTASIQRKQQSFYSKYKQVFFFVLYSILLLLLAGAVFYYLNYIRVESKEKYD